MSDDNASKVGRVIVLAVLAIATLGFGMAGLCGAVFTLMSLPQAFSPGPENFAGAALVIAVPSLLIGGGFAWLCGRAMVRRMGRRDNSAASDDAA
jgi:hypothetical protein